MPIFPRELMEEVIDKLAEPDPSQPQASLDISRYSLVSKGWLDRTRKHHFAYVGFDNPDKMEKWVERIDADNSGVSRHVQTLSLSSIKSLEGFKNHIRALTGVKNVEVWNCPLFKSPDQVRIFTEGLGKNLVDLELGEAQTTPEIMVSLLAGLPKLRTLYVIILSVDEPNLDAPAPSSEGIPFFESGEGRFKVLLSNPAQSGQFSWVPPTAKFSRVGLAAAGVPHDLDFINRLVSSSGETLTHFILEEDLDGPPSGNVDLSSCTSLTTVRIPILPDEPSSFASLVLPSITSSRLSKVVLAVECMYGGHFDPKGWEELELILSRLAKRLKKMHGIEITVAVDVSHCDEELTDLFFGESSLMSRLKEELDVEIWQEVHRDDEPFPSLAVV